MAVCQDCWLSKLQAREWLSKLNIGDKLLYAPPEMHLNKTSPTGDKFEAMFIKEKTDGYVLISYPNRNEQWDRKLPLKYAFTARPINSTSQSIISQIKNEVEYKDDEKVVIDNEDNAHCVNLKPIIHLSEQLIPTGHENEILIKSIPFKVLYLFGRDVSNEKCWKERARNSKIYFYKSNINNKIRIVVREQG
eukprot:289809_1